MTDSIVNALGNVFSWINLLTMNFGIAAGMIIGALPGLSVTMGVALLLPLTFGMEPSAGILLLVGVYCGGTYAGSISAVLLRTPGTPASAATAADGFALAQQGKASLALNLSLYASVIGGLLSGLALLVFAPQIANFALQFGPPEYFMLAVFGLTIIAGVSGNSLIKGLLVAFFGLLLSTVGIDPAQGIFRFTFKIPALTSGVSLIPALIGLFAIAEILNQAEKGAKSIAPPTLAKQEKFQLSDLKPYTKTLFNSSIIGIIIGAIPGTGGSIASFLAYQEAMRASKKPETYGHGNPDGVVASEAANNGVTGGALIPMMTLGVPGDPVTAVMLGALTIQGLAAGPQLFTKHGDIAYTVIVGFILVNIFMFFQAKVAIRYFSKLCQIPYSVLLPLILGLCLVGAFAVDNDMSGVGTALIFGLIGYILPKYGYPVIPLLIALILGPLAEQSLIQSMVLSQGSLSIFITRPISVVFLALIIISILINTKGLKTKVFRFIKA